MQHVPVVRILAVSDPLLNGLVPDGALVVVMLVGRVFVDCVPLQTVGGYAKYGFLFGSPAHIPRIVNHEEFAFLVALVVIKRQPDMVTRVVQDDVRGFVILERNALFAERLFPMQGVGPPRRSTALGCGPSRTRV